MSAREIFYQVDEDDQIIGSVPRNKAHENNKIIHRSVYIIVHNNKGEFLFQKRSTDKDTYPDHWALGVAGHVTFGESYRQSAIRELEEEIGQNTKVGYLGKILLKTPIETEYCALFETTLGNTDIKYQKEEISDIAWVEPHEIKDFVASNPVTPDTLIVLKKLSIV